MNPTPPNQDPFASRLHGPLTKAYAGLAADPPILRADEYPQGAPTTDKSCPHTSVPNVCEESTSSKACQQTSDRGCEVDTGNPACQSTSERGCLGGDTGNRTCQSTSDADCRSARGLPPELAQGWSAPPPLG